MLLTHQQFSKIIREKKTLKMTFLFLPSNAVRLNGSLLYFSQSFLATLVV